MFKNYNPLKYKSVKKKINFKFHENCGPERLQRMRNRFDELILENVSVEKRLGDTRIFGFEEFIENNDAEYFFNQHRLYCEHISIKLPTTMILMMNKTWNEPGAKGSGAGWHRDSGIETQHKTFFYLSDVTEQNGPFCIHDHSNYLVSMLDNPKTRLRGNFDFTFKTPDIIKKTVLGPRGTSFSCCTNFIHRGLPVIAGERYMLTVYAFNGDLPIHLQINTQ